MKPNWENDNIKLYHADCRDVIPFLSNIDAVVTDPPYGIGESNKKNLSRGKLAKQIDYGNIAIDYPDEEEWDKQPPDDELIQKLRSISKYQIIFGGNYFHLPPTKCWLVWDKQQTGDFADCELAWTNLNKAVRRITYLWNGMIKQEPEKRYHLTQKPLKVMEWCLSHLPKDVNIILDPFAGSGTTVIACIKQNKKCIAIEKGKNNFDNMVMRVKHELREELIGYKKGFKIF